MDPGACSDLIWVGRLLVSRVTDLFIMSGQTLFVLSDLSLTCLAPLTCSV